ncbi:glycosyltransferase family 39 protein [Halococcus sp. AFM35]|uniref:glycosyltransferase family 39 protein n=1 Tax=Halococcus sp. AFM35 TaxID=3421653 RepID=UPI003EC12CE9
MRTLRASSALAFFLGVLAHIESLGFWFTSYDSIALIETSRIGSFGDLWSILTKPLMYGTTYVEAGKFYRPFVNITYAAEYWIWGLNPFGYHLTNLLLHGLAAALVVATIYSLTESASIGGLTGVLFAIHPLSVDTVPAISRRQDILVAVFGLLMLWLFVEWFRREDARLRAGAVVAYALALLSKETAIVLGPLAFLWLVLQQPSLRRLRTYRRGITAVLPLAAVAVAYLVVRTVVLGGIGGYTHEPPLSQVLRFPFQYVLALIYQAHVFAVLRDVSLFLLTVVTVGVSILYLLLFRHDRSVHDIGPVSFLFVAIAVGGFGALTAILVVPGAIMSLNLPNVRSVSWYVVGVVFAVAATSAVAAALSSKEAVDAGSRRLSAFFVAWLAIPLPLFFVARQFAFRSAYFFVVPFLALLATYLTAGLSRFDSRRETGLPRRSTDAVLVFAVVVLLVPSIAASPLLYTDSGWGESGDITRQALTQVNRSVSEADANTRVVVVGVPTKIQHNPKRLGQARKVTMLQPHSLRSWLELQGHENPVAVGELHPFVTAPQSVSVTTDHGNGRLVVRLHYD